MPTARFERLEKDFAHATGRPIALAFDDDGSVVVRLDEQPHGAFWHAFPHEAEELLADVASTLQEVLSQEVWGGWPICPTHRTHPLDPSVIGGVACWTCPRGEFSRPIGGLAT